MDRLSLKLIFVRDHISNIPLVLGCLCTVGDGKYVEAAFQSLNDWGVGERATKRARLTFDLGVRSMQDLVRSKLAWCGEDDVAAQEKVWELIVAFIDSVRNRVCQCGISALLRAIMGTPRFYMKSMTRITDTEKRVRRKWPSFQTLPDDVLASMFTAEGTAFYGVRLHSETAYHRDPVDVNMDAAMFAAHVLRTHFPPKFQRKQSLAQALVVEILWRRKSSVTSRVSARQFTLAMLAASDRSVRVFVEMAPALAAVAKPCWCKLFVRALGNRPEFVDAMARSAANRVRVEQDILKRVLGVTAHQCLRGFWTRTGGSSEVLRALVFRAAAHRNCVYTVGVQAVAAELCAVRKACRGRLGCQGRQDRVTVVIGLYFTGEFPYEAMVERWPRIGEYVAGRLAVTAYELAAQCFLAHFLSGSELESALGQLNEDACNAGKREWPSLATRILHQRGKHPKKFKKVIL